MSLYNMLFGVNPMSGLLLQALGISTGDVPRFRDCYLGENGQIVIHTRTGGGNRDFHENEHRCRANYPEYFNDQEPPAGPWNDDLRKLPGFLYDEDDDFDSTYADFYFSVPESFKPLLTTLTDIGAGKEPEPKEKWQTLIDSLHSGNKTPETERALKVGEAILSQISAKLGDPDV